jgi:hypothetical protein
VPKTNGVTVMPLADLSHCDTQITLDCLRALYNINYVPLHGNANSYGIGLSFHSFAKNALVDTCDRFS